MTPPRGVGGALAPRGPVAFEAAPLTTRELEGLRLLASGASNREIADALGTAEGTGCRCAASVG